MKNRAFKKNVLQNNSIYLQYVNRLRELAISVFEWKNLPETIDETFMENILYKNGQCVFFKDDVMGFLALPSANAGKLNIYNIPTMRRAYASNGYNIKLNENNSVIIYNNMIRTNSVGDSFIYAEKLYNLDRAIDINANAQKTPLMIVCDENERLTMENIYMQYDGNAPIIKGVKGLNPNSFTVLKTDAPYVADKLYNLKHEIWNEALTVLGIDNTIDKKERLITSEVEKKQGITNACRYSKLNARKQACKMINKMFGLNIDCVFRGEYNE